MLIAILGATARSQAAGTYTFTGGEFFYEPVVLPGSRASLFCTPSPDGKSLRFGGTQQENANRGQTVQEFSGVSAIYRFYFEWRGPARESPQPINLVMRIYGYAFCEAGLSQVSPAHGPLSAKARIFNDNKATVFRELDWLYTGPPANPNPVVGQKQPILLGYEEVDGFSATRQSPGFYKGYVDCAVGLTFMLNPVNSDYPGRTSVVYAKVGIDVVATPVVRP